MTRTQAIAWLREAQACSANHALHVKCKVEQLAAAGEAVREAETGAERFADFEDRIAEHHASTLRAGGDVQVIEELPPELVETERQAHAADTHVRRVKAARAVIETEHRAALEEWGRANTGVREAVQSVIDADMEERVADCLAKRDAYNESRHQLGMLGWAYGRRYPHVMGGQLVSEPWVGPMRPMLSPNPWAAYRQELISNPDASPPAHSSQSVG